VVALTTGDEVGTGGLVELEEVLTGELHGGIDCFAAWFILGGVHCIF